MDTSDLSAKTFKAILLEAERFNHDLTLQYGLLSYQCKDEIMYIKMAEKLTRQMLTYSNEELDDIFFGNPPGKKEVHKALNKILENISKLVKQPHK
jgi:hypothetical protein